MFQRILCSVVCVLFPFGVIQSSNSSVEFPAYVANDLVGGCFQAWNDHPCVPTGVACSETGCSRVTDDGVDTWVCDGASDPETVIYIAGGIQTECWVADPGSWGHMNCDDMGTAACEVVQECGDPCVSFNFDYVCGRTGSLMDVDVNPVKRVHGANCLAPSIGPIGVVVAVPVP